MEEPFGVGTLRGQGCGEVGQASTDDVEGQVSLLAAVLGDQERVDQFRFEVLHLVDEQPEGGVLLLGQAGELFDEGLDVHVEQTGVGSTRGGVLQLGWSQGEGEVADELA